MRSSYATQRYGRGGSAGCQAAGAPAIIEALEPRTLLSSVAQGYPQLSTASGIPSVNARPAQVIPVPLFVGTGPWRLSFADEFSAMPDPQRWVQTIWGQRKTGQDESATYRARGVSVSDGILSLTASPTSTTSYVSGMINTGGVVGTQAPGFTFRYGYVEARIKMPAGRGLWPAFWMLPRPTATGQYRDDAGEIDVIEMLGQRPALAQVHMQLNGAREGRAVSVGTDLSQRFHTYGVHWEPGQMDWYLDGKLIYTLDGPTPSVREYLILNLAVGSPSSWPGAPDSSTQFPATMKVDYVRVWQQ